MLLSPKQKVFWNESNFRWNVKTGATRSGKTYLDYFIIPKRIRSLKGDGLLVILGNTQGTIERNILDPMRNIWGRAYIGTISSNNKVKLFGKEFYALGADKKSQVSKIQGAGIEYCYGDEITTWAEEVFQMLKSRLDKEHSCFDGTCNPEHPKHWFKRFLDSDADLLHQHYTIDDNPFLSDMFKENLKKEYAGTVFYDRFIKGLWVRAEGAIYRLFADNPDRFLYKDTLKQKDKFSRFDRMDLGLLNVGVDFGGNKSFHTFSATGITKGYKLVISLVSEKHSGATDPDELNRLFVEFVKRVLGMYGRIDCVYADSAEQVLIRGLKGAVFKAGLDVDIRNARKIEVIDRIRLVATLIATNRFFYTEDSVLVRDVLCEAVWDDKSDKSDKTNRLDDGTSDIDTLDAFEYTIERELRYLINF